MKKQVLSFLLFTGAMHADLCDDHYVQWFGLGHREGEGVGFSQGYTTLSTFLVAQKDFIPFCPFMDLRVHIFNQGRPAGNFGFGGRTFLDTHDAIAGVNVFYDFRKTDHRLAHQIGFGFEWLGKCWDFFANGYVPVGPLRSHFFDTVIAEERIPTFLAFEGNNLLLSPLETVISSKRQFEFGGFDAFAKRTFFDNGTLCCAVELGPYFYFGEYRKNIYGGTLRASANVMEYVVVGAEINYDSVFRTTANGFIGVQIPFGCRKIERRNPCNRCDVLMSKLIRRVDRREIIPVKIQRRVVTEMTPAQVARNLDGDPVVFRFVNNTNTGGDGTFEDPYSTLLAAQGGSNPDDVLYVYKGNGTSSGMNVGITLQDGQGLYGSGTAFTLTTLQGPVVIPAMTIGSPVITNVGGNAVTLANRNTVNGMQIQNPLANGIFGLNVTTGIVTNNVINLNGHGSGVSIQDSGGTFLVSQNTLFSSEASPAFPESGLYFNDTAGNTSTLTVTENTVTGFQASLRSFGQNGSNQSITITDNTVSDARDIGIDLSLFTDSVVEANVSNNIVHGNAVNGIIVFSGQQSLIEALVSNNVISNSTQTGLVVATGNGGLLSGTVQENRLVGNGIPGFLAETSISAPPGDVLCLRLNDNNSDFGYLLRNFVGSSTTFYLEPPIDNVGTITEVGPITPVAEGFCSE